MKPTPRRHRSRQAPISAPPPKNFFLRDSRARTSVLALLLVIATVAVYAPIHAQPLLNLDDHSYVSDKVLHDDLKGTFTRAFSRAHLEQPLAWLLAGASMKLFGLDPAGHHDESIFLHALNVVLLFWVLFRATGCVGRSWLVAALFALHPINVESVAWIATRHTLLSTTFCLLALGAYRWYALRPGVGRYSLVALLFALGLMAKPQVIMLPLALLLWDYWPLGRMCRENPSILDTNAQAVPAKGFWWLLAEKIPLSCICLLSAVPTLFARGAFRQSPDPSGWQSIGMQPVTMLVRLETALVYFVRYLQNGIWPANLALYYPHPSTSPQVWQVGGAAILLLTATVLACWARRHRYLIVGWLWFLITMVPLVGLISVGSVQLVADRYAYFSFLGLFIVAVWGTADWTASKRVPRWLMPAFAAVILFALTALTVRQVGFWQDNVAVWARSAEVSPNYWKAEYYLGAVLDTHGRHDEAITHYFRAASINPSDPYVNQGIVLYEHSHGNEALAEKYFKRILAWNVVHEPEDFDRWGKQFGVDRHSYYQHPELQP